MWINIFPINDNRFYSTKKSLKFAAELRYYHLKKTNKSVHDFFLIDTQST